MQAQKINASQRQPTPKHMPIIFTPAQLLNMDEAHLLKFVLLYHQYMVPENGATKDVADALGVETQTIGNYVAGRGQPGLDQLITLFNHTGCSLIYDWIQARREVLK